jgi:Flp pilus assembly pilin Flp
MNLKNIFIRFVKDERGQSTTEYILILSVVVMIAMKFKEVFRDRLIGTVNKLGGQIESATSE